MAIQQKMTILLNKSVSINVLSVNKIDQPVLGIFSIATLTSRPFSKCVAIVKHTEKQTICKAKPKKEFFAYAK